MPQESLEPEAAEILGLETEKVTAVIDHLETSDFIKRETLQYSVTSNQLPVIGSSTQQSVTRNQSRTIGNCSHQPVTTWNTRGSAHNPVLIVHYIIGY